MDNLYLYSIVRGIATLNKGDNSPLKTIGKFPNDELAKKACERHYAKSCKALNNLGKPLPQCFFI